MSFFKKVFVMLFFCIVCMGCTNSAKKNQSANESSPRIINIINFIRQTDYRVQNADSLLFETVCKQIDLLNKYSFPGTFLLQYDALINRKYQDLLKTKLGLESEVGAWWEITQPHVEAAGIKWRGEHSWVSHANIAFTTGYTPQEREKLVDVYMAKFNEVFGQYPKSVGSWFIDAHTLAYMCDKYGITASCNCKDQVGTDGYTLWGGYWNQAYYPSKKNAYMPAQTVQGQIPVPIFRMLGSDPIYQYETGVGTDGQGVISLEPVYNESGKDEKWVKYFLESIVNQPSLAFNYAQAGQENSFAWNGMREGLEMQFPILDLLKKENKIRIETLACSGEWFKKQFLVTPATAITTLSDVRSQGNRSVWYNSRYYRASLLWEKEAFCFRDIHLFDERFKSDYLETPGEEGQFKFFTLPMVDRYFWSTPEDKIGLRIVQMKESGKKKNVMLYNPIVTELSKTTLQIESTDEVGNKFTIKLHEDCIELLCKESTADFNWVLELKVPQERKERLPFGALEGSVLKANFKNFDYKVSCKKGSLKKGGDDCVFQLIPDGNELVIDCVSK
ncbi:MAG: hypothetical protein ACK5L5_11485 [Bacteroidales bacterium]